MEWYFKRRYSDAYFCTPGYYSDAYFFRTMAGNVIPTPISSFRAEALALEECALFVSRVCASLSR